MNDGSEPRRRAAAIGGVGLLLLPAPRGVRQRLRLGHPEASAAADRVADRAPVGLALVGVGFAAGAALPRLPAFAPRLYLLAVGLGLLSGIPHVLERRSARARLRRAAPPPPPLPPRDLPAARPQTEIERRAAGLLETAPADPAGALRLLGGIDAAGTPGVAELRLRALAAAALGDARAAPALALRAVQLDGGLWPLLEDSGLLLCTRGRFVPGIRLLEAARERSGDDPGARAALVEGLRLAGRLREAVTTLEGRDRAGLPRRPAPPGG